jgi:hypothetical protein
VEPSAGANEVELTKVPKSGGRRKKKGGGRKNKMGLASYKPASSIFSNFLIFFWNYEELPSISGVRICVQNLHFLKLASHLEVLNLPFLMELGDFIFFQYFFPKIRGHLDLPIHSWDFCFMKK